MVGSTISGKSASSALAIFLPHCAILALHIVGPVTKLAVTLAFTLTLWPGTTSLNAQNLEWSLRSWLRHTECQPTRHLQSWCSLQGGGDQCLCSQKLWPTNSAKIVLKWRECEFQLQSCLKKDLICMSLVHFWKRNGKTSGIPLVSCSCLWTSLLQRTCPQSEPWSKSYWRNDHWNHSVSDWRVTRTVHVCDRCDTRPLQWLKLSWAFLEILSARMNHITYRVLTLPVSPLASGNPSWIMKQFFNRPIF